jgi:hypothetical protein
LKRTTWVKRPRFFFAPMRVIVRLIARVILCKGRLNTVVSGDTHGLMLPSDRSHVRVFLLGERC